MKKANQKVKLLMLYDLLSRVTDEQHPLSTNEIIKILGDQGIRVTRKILPSDIMFLNVNGFEVLSYQDRSNYYYVRESKFDSKEIRMLMELVAEARLAYDDKRAILDKLVEMTFTRQAEFLTSHVIYEYQEGLVKDYKIYALDRMETAIRTGKKVSFVYHLLGSHKTEDFPKGYKYLVVNPLVILSKRGVHYLISYEDEYKGLTAYRLDRMDKVCLEETAVIPCPEYKNGDLESFRDRILDKFIGEEMEIKLRFDESLLNSVSDKMNQCLDFRKASNQTYRTTAKVRLDRDFFAWIVASGGKIKLEEPKAAVESFEKFVVEIKDNY